jgi:hypothetical protein
MSSDPVVAEIRRIREEIAARFNYDLDAILEDARRRDAADNRKVIRLPPRRSIPITPPAQEATKTS